jgi:transposase
MAAWRRAIELSPGDADTAKLGSIAQSRTEPASRVERARILLAYREDPSFFAVGRALAMHHHTVQRCVERAVAEGPMAALDDRPRPGRTAIKLILDNHSAQISRETKAWLAGQPVHRFEFTFTPKHGSWLNLVEGFFSKLARSVLRHIRVASKQELKDRLMAAVDYFDRDPVVHTWTYKLNKAA